MKKILHTDFPERNILTQRLLELRSNFQALMPTIMAENTGSEWNPIKGEFRFNFWNQAVMLSYPVGEAFQLSGEKRLKDIDQALILYYFSTADDSDLSWNWISFSDLQDGMFYNKAFQSYTGKELAIAYGDDLSRFIAAASKLGGIPGSLGDASFLFQVLPKVPVLVVYWLGDEDFPSSSQVLFDSQANHFLPTDAYAVLGSMLTRKLVELQKFT